MQTLSTILKENNIIINEEICNYDINCLNILTDLFVNNIVNDIDIKNNNLELYKVLYFHYIKKDYKYAQKEYKKYIKINLLSSYYYIMDLYLSKGNQNKALKYALLGYYKGQEEYNLCTNSNYDSIGYNNFYIKLYNELIFKIATIYYDLKQYTDSKIYLYECFNKDKIYLLMGNIYKNENNMNTALSFYKLGASNECLSTIENKNSCKYELAFYYFKINKEKKSKKMFKQIKDFKDSSYYLGIIYQKQATTNKLDKSLIYFNKSLDNKIRPNDCINNINNILSKKNNDELLIEFLNKHIHEYYNAAIILYNHYSKKDKNISNYLELVHLLLFKYKDVVIFTIIKDYGYTEIIGFLKLLKLSKDIIDEYANKPLYTLSYVTKKCLYKIIHFYYINHSYKDTLTNDEKLHYLKLADRFDEGDKNDNICIDIDIEFYKYYIDTKSYTNGIHRFISTRIFDKNYKYDIRLYYAGLCSILDYKNFKNNLDLKLGIQLLKKSSKTGYTPAKDYLKNNISWWHKIKY